MEFWSQHYYKLSRLLSSIVGQWPYQSVKEQIFYRGILFVLTILQLIPRARAVILYNDDPEIVLAAIGPFIIDTVFLIKTLNNYYNFKKMKLLLNKVQENWKLFAENELIILHQHSESGRKMTMIYFGVVFSGAAIFATEPIQLRLIHLFIKTNKTLPKFPMPVDYGSIDVDKYYYGLLFMSEMTTLLIVVGILACDAVFFIFAHHICGLFATVGYIIENLPINTANPLRDEEIVYIRRCIQIHSRTIILTDQIEELYIWNFFSVVGLNMILISITGVQIAINLDAVGRVVQYGSLTICQLGHLFMECLLGQRIIDYSLSIQEHISNAKWYECSIKSQRMINLLMLRSQHSSQLTAGKMLIMNFETFSMIVRTSASYFTVLLATQ